MEDRGVAVPKRPHVDLSYHVKYNPRYIICETFLYVGKGQSNTRKINFRSLRARNNAVGCRIRFIIDADGSVFFYICHSEMVIDNEIMISLVNLILEMSSELTKELQIYY